MSSLSSSFGLQQEKRCPPTLTSDALQIRFTASDLADKFPALVHLHLAGQYLVWEEHVQTLPQLQTLECHDGPGDRQYRALSGLTNIRALGMYHVRAILPNIYHSDPTIPINADFSEYVADQSQSAMRTACAPISSREF